MDVITAAAEEGSIGGDGGGGGCRVGGGSAVDTIDGATKLAGGVGGDVRRSSVAFCCAYNYISVFFRVVGTWRHGCGDVRGVL